MSKNTNTKNTNTLLMDSLNLPRFETIEELSELTRLSSRLLYCLSMKTDKFYKKYSITKRSGMPREISSPSYTLHIIQRWILINILNKILPSNRAMAFRKGDRFGHKQNAFYHGHTLYGLSLDLKDFFPSITADRIYTIFSSIGYGKFAATILTNLCTLEGKLPQGSACSPAISNIICITLDKRLIGLCEKRGIRYTRYADDMYFSCDDKALLLKNFPIIIKIIGDEGFVINKKKTHFHTPSNKKQITGITIAPIDAGDMIELKAPRKLKQIIRAEIYNCVISGKYEKKEHILGEIAYVNFVEKENKIKYITRIKNYIDKLTDKIKFFPELVEAYNKNKFFSDSNSIKVMNIEYIEEDEYMSYRRFFQARKTLLKKNGLEDICKYTGWDEIIENAEESTEEHFTIDIDF
ncbi:retron St85 family RNA-directed DNA polymerase [Anaerotignum sp.]|uniref:retron St85 family RNA-directed DNA polymerase n=1 Tax=Anaerotignum sp. TaxID=2039241 RepID=UPI0028AF7B18|nr:retron St85 family RNA-directed DNA polymerase [Anaerotignum sp.]